MSHTQGSAHFNRFRDASSEGADSCGPHASLQLHSVSENVDIFRHSPYFYQLSFQGDVAQSTRLSGGHQGNVHTMASGHSSPAPLLLAEHGNMAACSGAPYPPRPSAPGLPGRPSRQTSAEVSATRQLFATCSGQARQHALSVDCGCDEVFVEAGCEDRVAPRCLGNTRRAEVTFSTSSTVSILPNPYNRLNHRIHSVMCCCSCLHYVFFCYLPAIHYMQQSDAELGRNNQKRARSLGRTASFMFFTATLVTLSFLALLFFLAIFFAIY